MLLPLQGDHWKQWGELEKKRNREKHFDDTMEEFTAKNQDAQKTLRKEQVRLYLSSSSDFIQSIFYNLITIPALQEYFITWIKLFLDDQCRAVLPGLHDKYHQRCTDDRKQNCQQISGNQTELQLLEKELLDASFGLENILREFGQIYESANHSQDFFVRKMEHQGSALRNTAYQPEIQELPFVVANLLLKGVPFELMDGDAAFVPVTWVKAVFKELERITENKTLLVVSVVGIQSSGKSTLLNTMFGLQFAVSAGRCTRGVYCQLIPVDRQSTKLDCDYVLVVDTEGLRAPELQEQSRVHDNELATFVIGLGDITIVNIKGEIVADIEDVLQIVIHALLRIKLVNDKIKLKPTCIFVHQNVCSVSAETKMKFGQEKFHSFLDRMTKAAAHQENIIQYTRFDQVIQFDDQKHIWYIPDLWQGEQPMATVNLAYSEKVKQIRNSIIGDMTKSSNLVTVNRFSSRIHDLWNAILHENFVFSFKNCEESRAFLNLDAFFSSLSWDLKDESMKMIQQATSDILSLNDNLETVKNQKVTCILQQLLQKQVSLEEQLKRYFKESENRDILENWRSRYTENLRNLFTDERAEICRNMDIYVNLRSTQLQNEEEANKYTEKVIELARSTASYLKTKSGSKQMNDDELNRYFDREWSPWISQLSSTCDQEDAETIISKSFFSEIYNYFQSHAALLKEVLSGNPLKNFHNCSFDVVIFPLPKDLSYGETIKVLEEKDEQGNKDKTVKKIINFSSKATSDQNQIKCLSLARAKCAELMSEIAEYVTNLRGQDFQPNQTTKSFREWILFSKIWNPNEMISV